MKLFGNNNDNSKDNKKKDSKSKKKLKKFITLGLIKTSLVIIPIVLLIAVVSTFLSWITEIFTADRTAEKTYEQLQVQDVTELVQIKGDQTNGYYLDFVDDIDDKLKDVTDYLCSNAGVKSINDAEFIKKMIKAEIITQYPDLGGNVASSSGFQGAIDIIRVTPNKGVGELKNTGVGEKSVVNTDAEEDIINRNDINNQENNIKSWQNGKELKVVSDAMIYEQEDSTLHPGEKLDYWTQRVDKETQQYEKFDKDDIVTYTGNYSVSVNVQTNEGLIYIEVEKDDLKGYVKYSSLASNLESDKSDVEEISGGEFDNAGFIENGQETMVDSIESKVSKLTYVPKDVFDGYVSSGNLTEALKHFTFDDSGKLVTASWNMAADGTITINSNSSMNLKTSLQNLVMPWSYLLYFYIDADYKQFSNALADEVINSTIVVAVEDNISTTYTHSLTEEMKESEEAKFAYEWREFSTTENTTESCSTKVEVIYADTWCTKTVKETIYNNEISKMAAGEEKVITMPGRVTESPSVQYTDPLITETGEDTEQVWEYVRDENGNIIYTVDAQTGAISPQTQLVTKKYKYNKYQKTTTNTTIISNTYDSGEAKTNGDEAAFVKLYQEYKMENRLKESWLFQILERDERTANLVNLTKYLIYVATGENYGVLEYDFSEFDISNFNTIGGIYGDTVQEKVWFALLDAGYSKIAIAGLMGNIQQESGFATNNLQNSYNEKFSISDEAYTANVNSGSYSGSQFANDKAGYGLVQWTSSGRKAKLYAYAQSKGVTIDNAEMQIEFLLAELTPGGNGIADFQFKNQAQKSEWENASTVQEATELFCRYFERAGQAHMSNRISYAQQCYEQFKDMEAPSGDFYNIAYQLHEYLRTNMYWYPSSANIQAGGYVRDGESVTHKIPVMGEPENQRYVDCSSYVSWVITQYTGRTQLYSSVQILNNAMGFEEVSLSELQPGDIVVRSGHVEIYAGDNRTFNCGSTNAIRSETSGYSGNFTKAFRAP